MTSIWHMWEILTIIDRSGSATITHKANLGYSIQPRDREPHTFYKCCGIPRNQLKQIYDPAIGLGTCAEKLENSSSLLVWFGIWFLYNPHHYWEIRQIKELRKEWGFFSIISTCNFVRYNELHLMYVSRLDIPFENTNVYVQIRHSF